MADMAEPPCVTKETLLRQGRFVVFKELEWRDPYGNIRAWEAADRASDNGAVLIIARMIPSDRVLLIRQYRPPARRMVYEFPAGLIDDGETPEAAAARELREETGYVAGKMRIFPLAHTTPGLSNEAVHMVTAEIDESAPENLNPRTDFDPTEMIESLLLPRGELAAFSRRECDAGAAFDAKLAAYILALDGVGTAEPL